MKILIVSTVRFQLSGITSVILNYYRNMDKSAHKIDLVIPNEATEAHRQEFEANGSKIYSLPRSQNPLAYMHRLKKLMKENAYDVVHIHGNSAMMLFDVLPAKWAGIPVRIVHSHNTTCSHMTLHKLFLPLFRRAYTHGFACGEDAGKWLFGDEPFVVLNNGIDLSKYRYDEQVRSAYREKLGADGMTVIGHVGHFIEQKNHTFLLDSFAELLRRDERYLLLLIGGANLLEPMQEKAKTLGIADKVRFLGKVTDVEAWLQATDIFVLPSLYEGLPVSLVEAQASGLPCIVSDRVTAEVDLTGTLQFLPIDDPAVWADAIMAQSETLAASDRNAMGKLCQKLIAEEGYDVCANADRMLRLYESYLQERKQ